MSKTSVPSLGKQTMLGKYWWFDCGMENCLTVNNWKKIKCRLVVGCLVCFTKDSLII